ncbi:MAG: hypothetical protein CM15mP25_1170 [Gammaproteobacteria bacterium]|nr:MAG: hypothetical protein CM15mP25_1170 [Gammaproteobacteria bacterium]
MKAVAGGPIVGRELQEIREHMPRVDTRVAAIFRRGGEPIIPEVGRWSSLTTKCFLLPPGNISAM